jgi:hypothetical protein
MERLGKERDKCRSNLSYKEQLMWELWTFIHVVQYVVYPNEQKMVFFGSRTVGLL